MKKKIIIIILIFGIILVGCELFRNKRNNSEITISQDSSDLIEKTEEIVEENNNLIETKEEKKEDIDIKMTAIGDIMCHNTQYNDAYLADSKTYDFSYVFTDIEKYINSADIAVGNLETTFAGKERGYSSYPRFNTPEQLATNLKKLGIDVVSTANNHCMDTNYSGLVSTLKYLDEAEIAHTGTNESEESQNKILIQDVKGIKIAFLSFTYGTNGISIPSDKKYAVNLIDDELIIKQLQLAKEQKPDLICVSMHWGEEYQSLPNREQRELANWLLQQGVTHIIGSHPHVIQPMELRTNGTEQHIIVYSLGNFISNMSKANTDGGLIFTLQLEKHPLPQPIRPSYTGQSQTPLPDSNPLPFPYCRVSYCGYNLVWTGRPELTKEKNYILYPASFPTEHLTPEARKHLEIFVKSSRKLLQQHNIGIYEKKK